MTITGTIPALLTPFRDGGRTLDLDSMDAHVSWLAEHGVPQLAEAAADAAGRT